MTELTGRVSILLQKLRNKTWTTHVEDYELDHRTRVQFPAAPLL